jgi:hypothetical protein
MAKKTKQHEYYGGRIKTLVETVAKLIEKNPTLASNLPHLHATLAANLEGYGKRDKCYNCKRSMKITVYTADLHDALLILAMAQEVRKNIENRNLFNNFTEANKVHIPTLNATQATLKRQTKCDYLGLIKQPANWRGTGYWCLTSWAWKALRGDEIPKSVKYWEGNLIGRSDETTTLAGMFSTHTCLVQSAIAKRKAVRADYRANYQDYKPSDWSGFGGYIQDEKHD